MQTYPRWPNLATMLFSCARQWASRPLFRYHRDGAWRSLGWDEFARQAAACARGLRARGIAAGDRVLVVSENRPEVAIAELALMAIRAVPVPAYTTNTEADQAHILRDCGARAALVSGETLAAIVRKAAMNSGGLDDLIVFDSPDWQSMVADPGPADDIAAEAADIRAGAMACLIYTSGTGGPRGVMLPHRAILANCRGIFEAILKPIGLGHETYLSFLPMSHSYEHTVGLFLFPSIGCEIVYGRGIEHLAADMLAIRPTILTVVPRMLELIRGRVLTSLAQAKPARRRLFDLAVTIGQRRLDGGLNWRDRLLDPVLDRVVRRKIRDRFGGRLIAAVSGGARLEPQTARFFASLGITVLQGYGQSEAGPVISCNPYHAPRLDTVGVAIEGVEVRLAEDGEILVRGELMMDGYWRAPEATARAIRDGWLHTGDIGTLDEAGYLRITDRKRDVIVLSGGDKVWPARVESRLMAEPAIAQAVVAGDDRPALTALIVASDGFDAAGIVDAVRRVNAGLAAHERIRRHELVPPFTLGNGLLTPTQKIRRPLVLAAHSGLLAG